MGTGIVRLDRQRSLIAGNRLVDSTQRIEYETKVGVRFGIIGGRARRLLDQRPSALTISDLMCDHAEQMQRSWMLRFDIECFAVDGLGGLQAAGCMMLYAKTH